MLTFQNKYHSTKTLLTHPAFRQLQSSFCIFAHRSGFNTNSVSTIKKMTSPLENYHSNFKLFILNVFLPLKTPSVTRLDGINPLPQKNNTSKNLSVFFFSPLSTVFALYVGCRTQSGFSWNPLYYHYNFLSHDSSWMFL